MVDSHPLSVRDAVIAIALRALPVIVFGYFIVTTSYRLYFSPLARFPGPKLAGLTGWYEFYYECICKGRYYAEIERMHLIYGPIIRISPWEVHVNDPDWNEPYKISSRFNKDGWYYGFVGSSDSAFGTQDHDLHRIRRMAQAPYFTQSSVTSFEPGLQAMTDKLCAQILVHQGSEQPVNISNAYRSLATDVITEFAFHKSWNLLESPDFAAAFNRTLRDFAAIGIWNRHLGYIVDILQALPRWLVAIIDPTSMAVTEFFDEITKVTSNSMDSFTETDKEIKPDVIQQIMASRLPPQEITLTRLVMEARTIVGAGSETTGNTLSVTTYHLLANPTKAAKLKEELLQAMVNRQKVLSYQELFQLPYLSAVISEGLRLSSSVAGRLPRVNPQSATIYKEYSIPPGTTISTTQKFTHYNSSIFHSPEEFLPERWLDGVDSKNLEKYLTPFGRGSRSCLGITLAQAELFMTINQIFTKLRLELFETSREDIEQEHDYFSPFPKIDSKGVRVLIR